MKKVTLMLAALALVLGISQCKKQEQPVQAGEKQYIELTADNGNDGSKVSGSFSAAAMNLVWDDGDVITVSGGAEGTLTLDRGAGTSQGHFAGEVKLVSRADLVFTWTNLEGEPEYNNQAGTEDWIKDNLVLEARNAYNDNGKYSLKMEMPYAVLKLNLNVLVGESGNDVEISTGSDPVATVKILTKANSEEVYMAVPEVGEHTYTFSGNGESVDKSWTLEANTYYTAGTDGAAIEIKSSRPEGALKGLFTVGVDAEGNPRKVYFSKGNLQYLGQAEEGHKWRFAEHQWDIMGAGPSATSNKGNVDLGADYEGKYNTGSGSEAARDLFGWGCTGYEDTRKESHTDWYQKNYQPYSTSKSTVNATYNKYGYGPDYVSSPYYNLTVENKSDWGCLTIGSDPAGTWRTLSSAEWAYLFNTRMVNGGKGEGKSYRRATINSDASDGSKVYGLLLYPDGYTAQTAATSYTTEQWSAMESAGVAFLPAAGCRNGTSLGKVGSGGDYWSSSCRESDRAYYTGFDSFHLYLHSSLARCSGYSVRLVTNAN